MALHRRDGDAEDHVALTSHASRIVIPLDEHRLPPPEKRPRGRPRKPPIVPSRCKLSFDAVVKGTIEALARMVKGKSILPAVKERVRTEADRNASLRPCALRVLGFHLEHLNTQKGYNWHSTAAIAENRGLALRTVERAHTQLQDCGIILRKIIPMKGGNTRGGNSIQGLTAIPAILTAADAITAERAGIDPSKKANGPVQKSEWTRPKKRMDPSKWTGKH